MVKSPCRNICKYDDNFVCIGCLRTREEIKNWLTSDDEYKLKVIEEIKKREVAKKYDFYV